MNGFIPATKNQWKRSTQVFERSDIQWVISSTLTVASNKSLPYTAYNTMHTNLGICESWKSGGVLHSNDSTHSLCPKHYVHTPFLSWSLIDCTNYFGVDLWKQLIKCMILSFYCSSAVHTYNGVTISFNFILKSINHLNSKGENFLTYQWASIDACYQQSTKRIQHPMWYQLKVYSGHRKLKWRTKLL